MKLTTESLARFVGGQMEVQHPSQQYLYRGKVKSAWVDDDGELRVSFEWLAKGIGYPPDPSRWVSDDFHGLAWNCHLKLFNSCDIGEGRILLTSGIAGQTMVFFPPNGDKHLNPSVIEGLGQPICSER